MKTIWKYRIIARGRTDIDLPIGAKILDIQVQNGLFYAWVEVNPERNSELKSIMSVFTGEDIDTSHWRYIKTVQRYDLVYHFYEILE